MAMMATHKPFWAYKRIPPGESVAEFDLTGSLDTVPAAYLFATIRNEGNKGIILQHVAEELERRGIVTPKTRRNTSLSCTYCDKLALYIVGKRGFCRRHRQAGVEARKLVGHFLDQRQSDRAKAYLLAKLGRTQ